VPESKTVILNRKIAALKARRESAQAATPTTPGAASNTVSILKQMREEKTATQNPTGTYKPLGLLDLNGQKIGTEYKYVYADMKVSVNKTILELAKGEKANPEVTRNKYYDYVPTIEEKELVYQGIYDKTDLGTQKTAVQERLNQILSHLSMLKLKGAQYATALKQNDVLAGVILKVVSGILSANPVGAAFGLGVNALYNDSVNKQKATQADTLNRLSLDAAILSTEAEKLTDILKAVELKESLPENDGTGIDVNSEDNRSALFTTTNISIVLVLILIIYLYFKKRNQ
jgi:hypothetical protein